MRRNRGDVTPTDPGGGAGLTMADAPVGARLTVLRIDLDPARAVRLAQCGVRTGGGVTVLARTAGGGRLLGAGTARVAVDRATSDAVRVAVTPGASA